MTASVRDPSVLVPCRTRTAYFSRAKMNQATPRLLAVQRNVPFDSPQSVPSFPLPALPRSSKSIAKSDVSEQMSSPSRKPEFQVSPAARNDPFTLLRRAGGGSAQLPWFSLKQLWESVPVVISMYQRLS